ncbi:MAG: hypothetical protein WC887_00430 [Candidatus Paceibacterota bacterium]|jgi:hypothetical protein
MTSFENNTSRQSAINGLAIVGFIVLVAGGLWLAVYSTRFVPAVVNGTGAAAVYLVSFFTPESNLSVVPTPLSTTLFFGEASSTISMTATSTPEKIAASSTPIQWVPKAPVTISNNPAPAVPNYYGSPDLSVIIEGIGYMNGDILISTTTIPARAQIGVKFRVTNIGTNVSGPWAMNIAIPTGGASASQTFTQESLVPSQPSEYIVRFDNVASGADRQIVITLDPNHQLKELRTDNNSISAKVTIL